MNILQCPEDPATQLQIFCCVLVMQTQIINILQCPEDPATQIMNILLCPGDTESILLCPQIMSGVLQGYDAWSIVCVCVCVCVWEREKERECACVYVHACMYKCMHVSWWMHIVTYSSKSQIGKCSTCMYRLSSFYVAVTDASAAVGSVRHMQGLCGRHAEGPPAPVWRSPNHPGCCARQWRLPWLLWEVEGDFRYLCFRR